MSPPRPGGDASCLFPSAPATDSDFMTDDPMNDPAFSIHARQLYTGEAVLENATVRVEGGHISAVTEEEGFTDARESDPAVTPAPIDPHSPIGMHHSGDLAAEFAAPERMDPPTASPGRDARGGGLGRGQTAVRRAP